MTPLKLTLPAQKILNFNRLFPFQSWAVWQQAGRIQFFFQFTSFLIPTSQILEKKVFFFKLEMFKLIVPQNQNSDKLLFNVNIPMKSNTY